MKHMKERILIYKKPVPLKHTIRLLVTIKILLFSFFDTPFFAYVKNPKNLEATPELEAICQMVVNEKVAYLFGQFLGHKKEELRDSSKKKSKSSRGPVSKRKAPFYDAVHDILEKKTLSEYLSLAELVFEELGIPFSLQYM